MDCDVSNGKFARSLLISLVAVQLFDIAIHVGTGQVEPVRILSNVIIGSWAIWGFFSKTAALSGLIAIVFYVGLNGWFVAIHGITNPDQGGALRITLFFLFGLSTAIALWTRAIVDRD